MGIGCGEGRALRSGKGVEEMQVSMWIDNYTTEKSVDNYTTEKSARLYQKFDNARGSGYARARLAELDFTETMEE